MKKVLLLLTLGCFINNLPAFTDEGPVCHKCEKIREYNAAHPENNYYWYEDYQKDQGLCAPEPRQKAEGPSALPNK